MREEIEAAALFITRLVNKNLSSSDAGSTSSSIHSHSSSASSSLSSSLSTSSKSSASSTSSDGPAEFDDQAAATAASTGQITTTNTNSNNNNGDQACKVEQFRQCLEEALYERFHNHWFPEQPTKGQAYRCIRLNEWDRRDITLQKACSQCGIDYKDLQLPVELTLWVDPDEVTCRFGETKGSHCLVAKFKDGELKVEQNNLNLDINNIDIEIFRQAAANEGMRQQTNMHGSPDYNNKQHNRLNNSCGNINHNGSYQYHHHQNNGGHHHHQQQNHQSPHQHHHHQQQSSPHHHQHHQSPHRANIGKTAIFPTYHQGYSNGCDTNGNPMSYYYNF